MSLPRISIVVPSFNQGNYLEETLLSILAQQYPNLELFVIDGASTDNSVEIIKKHEDKINWWVSEKDNGQSEAINKGLRKVSGEIVSWVNSDDLLVPGSLQTIAATFLNLPQSTGLIHGGAVVFDAAKEKETRFTYQTPNREAYLSGMVFPQPAAFFRKTVIDKVGILNEGLHYGMDYDLFLRMSLVSDFLPVKDVFSKYRLHQQSKSVAESNRFISDWKKSFINLCKNLDWKNELGYLQQTGLFTNELSYHQSYSFVPSVSDRSPVDRHKALFFHLGHILKDLYWTGNMSEARKLKKRMKTDFDNNWWQEDPRLVFAARKLSYPDFALNTMKAVKNLIGKN